MGLFDNVSRNQLFSLGLGLMGRDPIQGALMGIQQGRQADREQSVYEREQRKIEEEQARQKAYQAAVARAAGMSNFGTPAGTTANRAAVRPGSPILGVPANGSFLQGTIQRIAQRNGSSAQQNSPQAPNRLLQDILRRKLDRGQPLPNVPQQPGTRFADGPPVQLASLAGGPGAGPSSGVDPNYLPPGMIIPVANEITSAGRQVYQTPGGERYSEKTVTVTHSSINNGAPTNIPTVFGGQILSEQEAVQRVAAAGGVDPETGRPLPAFSSIPEAVSAAKARSSSLTPQQPTQQPLLSPQEAAILATMDPAQGQRYLLDKMNQKEPERRIIKGADGFNYYADTRERVFPDVVSKPDDPLDIERKLDLAGITDPAERARLIRESISKPLVSVIDKGETKQQEKLGERFAAEFGAVQDSAQQARDTKRRVSRFRQISKGLNSGALAPTQQTLKQWAKAVGVDLESLGATDDVAQAEALNALSMDFVLDFIAQTKGAISEREMDAFAQASPGLSRTPEGNELILDYAEKVADRQVEIAKMQRDYMKRNDGLLDAGFADELDAYHEANPLFIDAPDDSQETTTPQVDYRTMSDDQLRRALGLE